MLTIDDNYQPLGPMVLHFDEFTRAIANYKHVLGRKLVRNLKLTDQVNAKTYKDLYELIMKMENTVYRLDTLVNFEKIVIKHPKIFFVGKWLIKQ